MTFELAPLRRADLPRCAELEQELFAGDDPWTEQQLHAELDETTNHYFGAYAAETGRLIGYAGLSLVGPPGDVEATVHTIGVDPAWQRRGVGRALLGRLLGIADEAGAAVFLEVRTDNTAAITLYEAHGFRTIGLRKRYYWPSRADAYSMARPARAVQEAGQ